MSDTTVIEDEAKEPVNNPNELVFDLAEPVQLDKKECSTFRFRKLKARERYEAIRLAGPDASGNLLVLEMILLTGKGDVTDSNGNVRSVPLTRDAVYEMALKDNLALEKKFDTFTGQ